VSALAVCSLRPGGPEVPGRCAWCLGTLPPRRRRWCGDRCKGTYLDNHFWGWARHLAIVRAGGFGEATCDQCGRRIRGAPEVNHVEPRAGAGYDDGCHHHQTNLQVLCHGCHVAETTRQIRERRGIPEGGRPPVDRFPGVRPIELWAAS
jgi:5-methylcytosine-specific restriction endonuclease McrA